MESFVSLNLTNNKIMVVIVVTNCIGIVLVAEHIVLILILLGESFISAV